MPQVADSQAACLWQQVDADKAGCCLHTCTITLGLDAAAAAGLKEPDSLKAGAAICTAAEGALAEALGRRLVCDASSFSLAAEYSPAVPHGSGTSC